MSKFRTGTVAALDIGSSKLCCFIARADSSGEIRVTGIGHQMSKGVRSGTIVDMDAAEISIRHAVHAAEQMAGETIESVAVNVSCGHPSSRTVGVEVAIDGYEIGDDDVGRVVRQGYQNGAGDRELLHMIPVGFSLDGARVADPRGMYGDRLGASMHLVTANSSAVRNLVTSIERCHLSIDTFVVSPYASGLSTLVGDEMELGVTVVDMGGGTTTLAVFFGGEVVYTDIIPIGGQHVTSDIARGLSTPVVAAERIKTLYGSAASLPSDNREFIDVPQIGEEEHAQANHVPKSVLVGIIRPRLEETFEHVRARLEASGFDRVAGRRLVLTGGASQLPGAADLATVILDKQVRLGRPLGIAGIAEATGGPAFAACAGLLLYAVHKPPALVERMAPAARNGAGVMGRMGRIGSWLRENF